MANKTLARVSSLLMIMFVIFFFMKLEARSLQNGALHVHKNLDSQRLLRELGFDLSKYRRRRVIDEASGDRRSPGGPDPKHHESPPNRF